MSLGEIQVRAAIVGIALLCSSSYAALSQGAFNNWARCTNTNISPDNRINYCKRLLNSGGGPDSEITVLTVLGSLYREMHDYPAALDSYSRAAGFEALGVSDIHQVTHAPGSAISIPTSGALIGALEGRAEVYALTGKPDLALADAEHIFRLAPDAANSYAIRCRVRTLLKLDLAKAQSDCTQAAKLEPKNTQVLGASGLLLYQLGNLKDAQADFDQALSISPKLAGALYMRGVIENRRGNKEAGAADIAAARNEDPDIASSFADLGVAP